MKTLIVYFTALAVLIPAASVSCRRKEKGNCYCKYVSGDRTHYDLTSLPRNEQEDSCRVLDNNAAGFGGDCKLK